MQTSVHRIASLPSMAWALSWPRGGQPRGHLGEQVARRGSGWFEGTWGLGDDPAPAAQVYGSGVVPVGDRLLLVAPSHNVESLFVYRGPRGVVAANSLALLLAVAGVAMPFDRRLGARFATIVYGIDRYERLLVRWPDGGELERLAYDNAFLDEHGQLHRVRKPLDPPFPDVSAYRDYAVATFAATFAHAPGLIPTATCSSGYDSAGLAVLSAAAGCRQAVALARSRRGDEDTGAAVAERLGLALHTAERLDRVDSWSQVSDYFATGCSGQDACYQPLEPWLRGRLLVTGFGRLWDLRGSADAVLSRGDLSGVSLQEVRLLHRFVHLPGLMIGGRRHPELVAMAYSPALAPWRLGGSYDRPVARWVIESAGVPRGTFAVQKRAASLLGFRDESLWSEAARAECRAACPESWVAAAASWSVRAGDGWDRLRWFLLRHLPNGKAAVARWFRDDRVQQMAGLDNVLRFGAGLAGLVARYQRWLDGAGLGRD
ncbi:MAG: hypothetical protein JNK49_04495 [Planctomycetes bacterium]|nr:hypothetical protein [Planctomycetota bacterium]